MTSDVAGFALARHLLGERAREEQLPGASMEAPGPLVWNLDALVLAEQPVEKKVENLFRNWKNGRVPECTDMNDIE